MATVTKKKKNRLLRGLGASLFYMGLFVVLILLCGRRLNDFLRLYEANQPSFVVDAYLESFDDEHVSRLCTPYLDTLDQRFISRDAAYAVLAERFQGELSCRKDYRNSTNELSTYHLFNGDTELGSFQLHITDSACYFPWMEKVPGLSIASNYFSLSTAQIENEQFAFSVALDACKVLVGSSCKVLINGVELGDDLLIRENIESPLSKVFPGTTGFPTRKEYAVSGIYGEPDIQVQLPDGSTIPYSSIDPEENELFFLVNCSKAEQAQLLAFCEEFTDAYIKFTSNYLRRPDINLATLLGYLDNNDLADKFRLSTEAMNYTKSYDDSITAVSIIPVKLSEHTYFIHCDYTLDTKNKAEEHVVTNNSLSLILSNDSGKLLVKDMLVGGRTTVNAG